MENTIIPIIISTPKTLGGGITIYVSLNETIASAKEKYYNKVGSKYNYIWQYEQLSWKQKIELWFAADNMLPAAKLFKRILECQYKIRHL